MQIRYFTGEYTLNNVEKEKLSELSEILTKNPTTEIRIEGHTDNVSALELNQYLSINRAQVVADFLMTKNVKASQVKGIIGKNFSEPVADNSTETGRVANRRTEIYILVEKGFKTETDKIASVDSLKSNPIPASLKKELEQLIHQPIKATDVEIEIDGLLVDDTKTKAGKDFYDMFYDGWEAPKDARNYSITVSEKPFRLTSTLIVISINDDIVYQAILQPRQDLIEVQTDEAISTTQNYLANYEEITKQLNGDDMAGTGIY